MLTAAQIGFIFVAIPGTVF